MRDSATTVRKCTRITNERASIGEQIFLRRPPMRLALPIDLIMRAWNQRYATSRTRVRTRRRVWVGQVGGVEAEKLHSGERDVISPLRRPRAPTYSHVRPNSAFRACKIPRANPRPVETSDCVSQFALESDSRLTDTDVPSSSSPPFVFFSHFVEFGGIARVDIFFPESIRYRFAGEISR